MHRTTLRFRKCFERLPLPVQNNPKHPSLHFKKVGKFWSARIGMAYRALAYEDGEDFIWVWIGSHDDYMKMIKQGSAGQ